MMDDNQKALDLREKADMIARAFFQQFGSDGYEVAEPWVSFVYDTHLICEFKGTYYRVPYTMRRREVSFAMRDSWEPVEKEWVTVSSASDFKDIGDVLIAHGGAVKSLGDGKFEGQLVRFGSPDETDLGGEYFDATTDFGVKDGDPVTLYYKHGKHKSVGKRSIGRGNLRIDDAGIFLQGEIEQRDAYEKAIYELAQKGKLGLSSGAAAHLIEREPVGKSTHIAQWQIAEASLTTIPYEWRSIVSAKSLDGDDELETILKSLVIAAEDTPEANPEALSGAGEAVDTSPADNVRTETHSIEVKDMAEQNVPAPEQTDEHKAAVDSAYKSLEAKLTEQGNQITSLLKYIEDSPAIRRTGYYSVDGGKADPNVKSMGDFMLAIIRGDEQRLVQHYKSTKDIDSTTSASGGYLVPTEFMPTLMKVNPFETPALSMVNRMQVNAPSGEIPALDQFFTPTAGVGQTAAAGRVTTAIRSEGGAYTETQPQFEQIQWRVYDVASGYVEVSKELRADSALAVESLLTNLIRVAVNAKMEYFIWQGTGAGQPLGILNAPALVQVDADTNDAFVFADAVEMYSRLLTIGGRVAWTIHPSAIPDIAALAVGSTMTTYVDSPQNALPMRLLGFPIGQCEHLAQTNNPNDITLCDFSAYYLFERGGLYIDFSEHAAFTSGKDTWRFGQRVDGQPWLKSAVTLADATGSFTKSPFVTNND